MTCGKTIILKPSISQNFKNNFKNVHQIGEFYQLAKFHQSPNEKEIHLQIHFRLFGQTTFKSCDTVLIRL